MRRTTYMLPLLVVAMMIGCSSTKPESEAKQENLVNEANNTLEELKTADPSLDDFMDKAYGYAVFPSVGKGGLIVGGAHGRGVVYEQGAAVGYAQLTQATVGAQAGGQSFDEVIVFENKSALDRFRSSNFEFSANASAVALKSGAAATARYQDGVAIFTKPEGGLMFEASVGGQKFQYEPMGE